MACRWGDRQGSPGEENELTAWQDEVPGSEKTGKLIRHVKQNQMTTN